MGWGHYLRVRGRVRGRVRVRLRVRLRLGDQVPMLLMVNQLMDPLEFIPNQLSEFH